MPTETPITSTDIAKSFDDVQDPETNDPEVEYIDRKLETDKPVPELIEYGHPIVIGRKHEGEEQTLRARQINGLSTQGVFLEPVAYGQDYKAMSRTALVMYAAQPEGNTYNTIVYNAGIRDVVHNIYNPDGTIMERKILRGTGSVQQENTKRAELRDQGQQVEDLTPDEIVQMRSGSLFIARENKFLICASTKSLSTLEVSIPANPIKEPGLEFQMTHLDSKKHPYGKLRPDHVYEPDPPTSVYDEELQKAEKYQEVI
ncbi:hypothetical protein COX08_00485 [Candidatus Beckwithbacteria bacterium CG23_combo_of_CG06-09_8_20_14_all_34_8]|uniref:Uncharacterized protein n=1 Tax=Candidatus Beckwithbacteria bacterium CG23_combo_of_CG06-09_8_20_14_all_34_8 TaxID=1974497 RepID=A0A2H0B794_9BACT|nr:MAG: hypothetical protein COX08_00485 [Candidatus Beckwithbacteria bacterium CG23_combo_of_CG06-09_8_20_14_all_34_8]